MSQHSTLTKLETQLINKLQEATDFLKFADGELDSLRQTNAKLKAKLQDSPILPANFRASAITQQRLNETKAAYSEAKRQLQQEIDQYHETLLHEIAHRNTKQAQALEYKNATTNGSYATAMNAILAKRQEVRLNGVEVTSHMSGTFKALPDWQDSTLFTFETILDDSVEISGREYRIVKSEVSSIGSGNTYHISPVRHSNR